MAVLRFARHLHLWSLEDSNVL